MLDRRRGIVLPFGGDVFRGKRLFFDGLEAQGNQADVLVPFLRPPLERRENVRGRGGYDHGVPFGPRRFFRLFQVGDLVCTMELLAEKAENPHLLVMSATPIPRTLGLLLYGDLDISILDELPPGRKPVKTRCITGKKRRDLYGFLDREINTGRQVYIVCPAIEDTPDGGLNAVKTYYEDIAKALLPDRRVGLMHGKLKPKEKAAVMEDFKAGQLDALVSTTVIEVGVDVPNATVMVIENAERYGLSALHQLRGRVGRGAAESWCFLVSDNTSEPVQKRLKFLCSTADGFAVAQYDLETRGPGDFFGSRQHGLPTLQIADLMNDTRTLHAAQSEAAALLAEDPLLTAPDHALLAAQVEQMFEKAGAMN